jgi:hypothetical protein
MRKLKIIMDGKEVTAELIDRNPKTAGAVWNALPIQSRINTWGDEIYFGTTVKMDEENAQEKVEVGDVAYWPEGRCICVFFGKTPASTNESPKAYSPITESTFGVFLIFQEKPLAFP